MNIRHEPARLVTLIIAAAALLGSTSIAWGQAQIKKTFAFHGPASISIADFEKGQALKTVDEEGTVFVDIAFGAGPDSLLAAAGTKLYLYPAAKGPAILVHDFAPDMRSILAIAVDPNSERIYAFTERKGKPTFKLLVGEKTLAAPPYWAFSGDVVQEDFPKFVDAVAVSKNPALGDGVLAADEKALYFLAASANPAFTAVRVADKKFIGLLGPESITGTTLIPGTQIALVGTDRRRLLAVDLAGIAPTASFGGVNPLSIDSCMSDRDQVIGLAAADLSADGTVIMVSDLACDELRLFDGDGASLGAALQSTDPQDPAAVEGVPLDLGDCADENGCDFAEPGVVTVEVRGFTGSAQATLRHVTGMTDCRCTGDCAVAPLNLVDLLPDGVVDLGIVPDPTWIPAWLQADVEYACKLGAFIVKTAPGTQTDIIDSAWEVQQLFGRDQDNRCETGLARSDYPDIDAILDWDVIGYSPTEGVTVCPDCLVGPTEPELGYEITISNTDCVNPIEGKSREFSVFLYGLAIPVTGPTTVVDVTDQLLTDLGTAIDELAQPLLWQSDYVKLQSRYLNVMDKWTKAKDAMVNQPNAADTTLSAVVSQLQNLKYENRNEVSYCPEPSVCLADTDNIQGEIEVRVDSLVFLIEERLRASVPLVGF